MANIIQARNLYKSYGKQAALTDVNLTIEQGEIVGVVGTNGAGKSTLLKSILGLTSATGELSVCGLNPRHQQAKMMEKVSFIADTAILPKWITPAQLFEYSQQVHPNFDIKLAEQFLARTNIKPNMKVKNMSKGMVTQLHLAIVIAIDSELLVLDEPTLGLDVIRRKSFYNSLLEDYFDDNNTIVITTHQIEEVEHILTRVIFIDNGQVLLDVQMQDFAEQFVQLTTHASNKAQVELFSPMHSTKVLDGLAYIFDMQKSDVSMEQLQQFGSTKTPNLADIFVALVEGKTAHKTQQEVTYA
ncbi:multidrug ABC transporter ATPase [Catenovulum agarivorans DS-2]|uniref:Multidrug ABC transporter ATPase n=1 Tax=Catenovulum agarivorans DS-2 TaxID=1328313 RepID=W7QBJ7_9ALTE|nr:ABC transporter ATP-binding protein [Catenovulum agarivorans]EWH10184.1 multidrug ABC transporter ATPase [Catenovulum agarivorans DS-2]